MSHELRIPHGIVESTKDALVKDLKGVIDDADALLKDATNATTEELAAVYAKLEHKLGQAKSSMDSARHVVSEKARDAAEATQDYVMENPWKAVGIAAVALALGFLLSRR